MSFTQLSGRLGSVCSLTYQLGLFEQREKARRDRHGGDEYVRDEGRADIIRTALAVGSSLEDNACSGIPFDFEQNYC